ncbi:MAG: hypothetical protein HKO82_07570 [Acidimicrobiia bacterium]|nr:hypothetical protein [Acidimicrobiia bacterium]
MRRFAVGLLAALTAVAAWTMPAPETAAGAVDDLPEPVAENRSQVWFCPGAAGEVNPVLAAQLVSPGIVGFSLPVGGEIIDSFQNRIEAGVGDWDVGDLLLFHPGPAIVETSRSPSAAAVIYRGPDQLAADGCSTAAKEWYLNGARIGQGDTLTLRLFNPLLEQGRVALEVVSEFGFEPLLDLQNMSIGPRSWEDVSLSLLLGEREQMAVRVSVVEGVVIPSMHRVTENALAAWPGESPSARWEFPLAQVAGTDGTISVWNPGAEPAEVGLELVDRQGPIGRFDLNVAPGREETFNISSVTTREAGLVLTSNVAVVAAVRSDGPAGAAATVGAPRPADRWLVPAHGVVGGLDSFVFVLNSGDEPVEVSAGPAGGEAGAPVDVPPHSIARLDIGGRGADIAASGPVSVAWVVTNEDDTGLGLGVPVAATAP